MGPFISPGRLRPTLGRTAGVAFALIFLLAAGNFILVDHLLRRLSEVTDAVVSTGKLHILTKKVLSAAGYRNPPPDDKSDVFAQLVPELDREVNNWDTAEISAGMARASRSPEAAELLESLRSDWEGFRDAYHAFRDGRPDSDGVLLKRLQGAATGLQASINSSVFTLASRSPDLSRRTRYVLMATAWVDGMLLVILFLALKRYVVRPVGMLTEASRRFSSGERNARVDYRARDEIGELAATFNHCAEQIENLIARIEADGKALKQAESMFRGLAEKFTVGVYLIQDQKFVYANPKLAEFFGYAGDELAAVPRVSDLAAPEHRLLVEENIRKCAEGGVGSMRCEFRGNRKDGTYIDLEVFGTCTEINGRVAIIGTLIDITERRRAEARLQKLSHAIEQSPVTVVITDVHGNIEYLNPHFTQSTGYTYEEAKGKTPSMLKSGSTPLHLYKTLWETILSGHQWRGELLNRKKNGELFWEHEIVSPIKSGDGSITHFIAVKEDITERKRAEAALRRMNRTLAVLSECNQALVRTGDETDLLHKICRNIVEIGGYRLAWVGYPEQDERQSVRPMARAGFGKECLDTFRPSWAENEGGNGPTGSVIRTGKMVIAHGIRGNPFYAPCHGMAERVGFDSAISLPLRDGDKVLGALSIYSEEQAGAFDRDEVNLLNELAEDLAYGIASLRVRAERDEALQALRDSEEKFRSISASAQDAIIMIDGHGAISYWNAAAEKIFGYAGAEIIGKDVHSLLAPGKYLDGIKRGFGDFRAVGSGALVGRTRELEGITRDGAQFPIELSVSAVTIQGKWHAVGVVRDITERKRTESALRLRDRAIESSSNGVVIMQLFQGQPGIIYANPAFERITGYSIEEALGTDGRFLLGTDLNQPELEALTAAIREKKEARLLLRNYRKDGTLFWNELHIAPVRDPSGEATHYVILINDVTERRRYEQELEYHANYDTLTGLPNRNLLNDRLDQAIVYAHRHELEIAVLFVDLDHFKFINDSLGHNVGDLVLKTISARLKDCLRDEDTIARLGGDEFVLVLSGATKDEQLTAVMQRILSEIARPVAVEGREIIMTCSIGASMYPADGHTAEALLKNADAAMYRAKERGRNNFRFYLAEMNARLSERLNLEADLRRALDRDELLLRYQPQIDLKSGRVIGAEALIRWMHPQMGLVAPARFIPLAEETGLVVPIGEWVLRTVCAQNKAWLEDGGTPLCIAVNLSARQFRHEFFVKLIADILADTGLDPSYLELELTESMVMEDVDSMIRMLYELKQLGIKLSIDDFGTGYSSLSYLKRFAIDKLKIDQSFVRDIATDPNDAAISTAVIALAHSLNLRVIAEGVETEEQLRFLYSNGCDEVQGYYFSRPVSGQEFPDVLRAGIRPPAFQAG